MGQALYRKYRPKSLTDVAGQDHITTTLANAIKAGKLSHAYLLTGPRGVGKTSIARILAHQINDIPYDEKGIHLDIIEIDAASNRRIDEVRDLRDKVHILPTSSKYKVYIIDEVHMLTREAFNALLKTLEEPPEHVIFILATTEAHKLPETIISRTQHFAFKPIELKTLVDHLKTITKAEKIKIEDAGLELIAVHGDGSFRDSISLLDQARGLSDSVTATDVQNLLGIAPAAALQKLLGVVTSGAPKDLFDLLIELRGQGLQSGKLAQQLSEQIRSLMMDDAHFQNQRTTKLLNDLLGVTASAQADRMLELVLLDYLFAANPTTAQTAPPSTPAQSVAAKVEAPTKAVNEPSTKVGPIVKTKPKAEIGPIETVPVDKPKPEPKTADSQAPASDEPFSVEAWPVVLASIKKKYNTLYSILRMAEASFADGKLTLNCKFAFHQKQINESKNRKIISDLISDHTGQDIEIVCKVMEKSDEKTNLKAKSAAAISNVSDIFGGAEVLES